MIELSVADVVPTKIIEKYMFQIKFIDYFRHANKNISEVYVSNMHEGGGGVWEYWMGMRILNGVLVIFRAHRKSVRELVWPILNPEIFTVTPLFL